MAARLLGVRRVIRPVDEYLIWRRANTLFMGQGHPGCSAAGLGIVAQAFGLRATIWHHESELIFAGSIEAGQAHRDIMLAVLREDRAHFIAAGGSVRHRLPDAAALRSRLLDGEVALALVVEPDPAGPEAGGEPELHWVVVAEVDADSAVVLNPAHLPEGALVRVERMPLARLAGELAHGPEGRGSVLFLRRPSSPGRTRSDNP
jgi:hypothetical protein